MRQPVNIHRLTSIMIASGIGLGFLAAAMAGSPPRAVAGAQNATLMAIPTNTALDLGEYGCDQPVDDSYYCESITDYSGFVYDTTHHRFVMFGGGHAATFRDDLSMFDFATLKWSSAYPSTLCADMTLGNMDKPLMRWSTTGHPFSRHTYDLNVVAENTGEFLVLAGTNGRGFCTPEIDPGTGSDPFYLPKKYTAYDLSASAWHIEDRETPWDGLASAEYDPVSGKVVILSAYGLWILDPATHTTIQALDQFSNPLATDLGYANNLTYYPPNQRLYYFARGNPTLVFEVQLNRSDWSASTVTPLPTPANAPDSEGSGWVYDTVNGLIGGGVRDGVFHAYNPVNNTWASRTMVVQSSQGTAPIGTQAFHAIGFDPVDGVYVFITDGASGRHTWAYRYGGTVATPMPPPTFAPSQTERLHLPVVRRP